jgi:hypothetical protein
VQSTDQGGLLQDKSFTITVMDINDPPVALNDSFWVSMGTPEFLPVLENDTDVDHLLDPETIEVIEGPQNGTARRSDQGGLEYVPRLGFRGVDSFTYHVRDKLGLVSNVATVNLRINSAPLAQPDSFLARANRSSALEIMKNDTDPDGSIDPSTISILSNPENADLQVQPDGQILINPRTGFLGRVDFRYVVSDNEGRPSSTADVTVQVVVSTFQNPRNHYDVDADLNVSPLDVLVIINLLNSRGASIDVDVLSGSPPYVDVNGNNMVDPLDVLQVINFINSGGGASGEGEGPSVNGWQATEVAGREVFNTLDDTTADLHAHRQIAIGQKWIDSEDRSAVSRTYDASRSLEHHAKQKMKTLRRRLDQETALIDRVFEEVWASQEWDH